MLAWIEGRIVEREPPSLVAMFVILLAAGFLLFLSWVGLIGGWENTETSERQFALLALGAAVGFGSAVAAIYGLAVRSPTVTRVAALAQASAAVFLIVVCTSLSSSAESLIAGLLGVIAIDILALYAARPT